MLKLNDLPPHLDYMKVRQSIKVWKPCKQILLIQRTTFNVDLPNSIASEGDKLGKKFVELLLLFFIFYNEKGCRLVLLAYGRVSQN